MDLKVSQFATIFELLQAFPNEQSCINHLEALRWDGVIISPFDETSKVYKCKGNKYKCKNTGKYFNVRTGTIFEDTKVPLQKWFMALYVFSSHKKGISSHQLAKDIGITQKSAWFLLHRLRYAFNHPAFKEVLGNVVEVDETYIGGNEKNKHANKRTKGNQGRSAKTKKPIVGMLEREGNVIAQVVNDTKKRTLEPIVMQNIQAGAQVMTDEWAGYTGLHKKFEHNIIHHSGNEYVNGMTHTQGIEGFWSHLKRGIDGIYHHVSFGHLQSYVDEFSLRFNTRKFTTVNRFDLILGNVAGKRLTYKDLVNHD